MKHTVRVPRFAPWLLSLLLAGCGGRDGSPQGSARRSESAPRPGAASAPAAASATAADREPATAAARSLADVTVYDAEGKPFPLARLRGGYSVLVCGCPTCPPFLEKLPELEAVFRDYAPKGVRFRLVFGGLMHPEAETYLTPYSLRDRAALAAAAGERLGTAIPWLVDTSSWELKRRLSAALGYAPPREQRFLPNAEAILDPDGNLAGVWHWSDPAALRAELERLVGPVPRPTRPAAKAPAVASVAVLAPGRVAGDVKTLPPNRLPVEPRAGGDDEPYYAKLEVRAGDDYRSSGRGAVCFALRLDPVYRVHWNPLVPPRVEIADDAAGVEIAAESLDYDVAGANAVLTRQATAGVDFRRPRKPVTVTVRYAVCDEDGRWCRTLTQAYSVTF